MQLSMIQISLVMATAYKSESSTCCLCWQRIPSSCCIVFEESECTTVPAIKHACKMRLSTKRYLKKNQLIFLRSQVILEVSSAVKDGLKRKFGAEVESGTGTGGALKKCLGGSMFDSLHGDSSDQDDSD